MRTMGPVFRFLRISCVVLLVGTGFRANAQTAQPATVQAFKLISTSSGWLLASGRLFWTASAGSQWSEITPPASNGAAVAGAYFLPDGHGWAVQASPDGATLSIARTSDNGAHWTTSTLTPPFTEADVFGGKAYPFFADAQNGWLMLTLQSGSAFRLGSLFRTVDGGQTWTPMPRPPVGGELYFTDATHGFVGPGPAGDEFFRTTDAGQTWQAATLPTPSTDLTSTTSSISLPVFTDATRGTLLRTYQGDQGTTAVAYSTRDGGASWTPASTSVQSSSSLVALSRDGALASALTPVRPQADLAGGAAVAALSPSMSSFATANVGWVQFQGGNCDAAQGSCTQTSELMGTLDGGKTYFALGQIPGAALQSTQSVAMPKSSNSAAPALAKPDSSRVVTGVMGFDACTLPTTAQMQTWYTSSPYRVIGAYIGGNEFACKSGLTNFTAAWTSTVLNMGWEIMPIWVGPQAPGNGSKFSFLISTDPTTAQAQGITEADSAIAAMAARGMGQGSPIVYDMEAYPYTVAANVTGTQAFLDGWDTELHAKGYLAAVYSSHPEIDAWTLPNVSPALDIVSFAYFFSSGVACGATCQTVFPTQTSSFDLPPNYWVNDHRNRQTSSGFNSTYGGVTLNVDEDWTDASMVVATPNVLTVAKAGAGTGTIASTQVSNGTDTTIDTAISCGTTCPSAQSSFASTDIVTLTATADAGSSFASWTGCSSTTGTTCTVTVSAATTVTATFTGGYALTVTKAGAGSGTVTASDSSIACGSTCTANYAASTVVTLTAAPAVGSVFTSWTGCTSTSGSTCTVTMAAAESVTATFSPAVTTYILTVAKAGAGTGTVSSSDSSINCGSTCSVSYGPATVVVLSATPAAGSVFSSWTGCTTSTGSACSVTMSAAQTVTANFAIAPTFTSSLSSTSLSVVSGQSTNDTLTITPQTGYTGTFSSFSCTGLPASATCSFNPTTLTTTGNGAVLTTTLTIATTHVTSQLLVPGMQIVLAGLALPALLLPFGFRRRWSSAFGSRIHTLALMLCAGSALLASQVLLGCGGGGGSPAPPTGPVFNGTVTVNMTTPSGATQLPLQLTITP